METKAPDLARAESQATTYVLVVKTGCETKTKVKLMSLLKVAHSSHQDKSQRQLTARGTELRIVKAIGLEGPGQLALAPCVKSPHPETDLPEAKQLRLCVLSKSGLRN